MTTTQRIARKHFVYTGKYVSKGKGRTTLLVKCELRSGTYLDYLDELKEVDRTAYALELLNSAKWDYLDGEVDREYYKQRIYDVRQRYGLSYEAVAAYYKVGR
jgi:alpha-glucuronidase